MGDPYLTMMMLVGSLNQTAENLETAAPLAQGAAAYSKTNTSYTGTYTDLSLAYQSAVAGATAVKVIAKAPLAAKYDEAQMQLTAAATALSRAVAAIG
jgi:hypothetical protein